MIPDSMGIEAQVPLRPTDMHFEKLLRRGGFSKVTPMLDKFSLTGTVSGTLLHVVNFGVPVTLEEAIERAGMDSLQPALLDHLLTLCRREREMSFTNPLVFPGSAWRVGRSIRTTFFPYVMDGYRYRRHLRARSNEREFGTNWRFAMVLN